MIAAAAGAGAGLSAGAWAGIFGGALLAGGLIGFLIGDAATRRYRSITELEADQLIRGKYGANLATAIAAGTQARGRVRVVDDAQYRVAYTNRYGSIDANYPNVAAFVDRSTNPPTVWLHKDRQYTDVVLHEAMHVYSDPAIRTSLDSPGADGTLHVNEGITEYFSRQIAEDQLLRGTANAYSDEVDEVRALVEVCGEDVLRRAYFQGDIAGLRNAVDNALGAGTLNNWVAQMVAQNWSAARALLRRR